MSLLITTFIRVIYELIMRMTILTCERISFFAALSSTRREDKVLLMIFKNELKNNNENNMKI